MSIESRHIGQKPKFSWDNAKYPMLGTLSGTGCVVLFFGNNVGVVVHAGIATHKVGHYNRNWLMTTFIPTTGSVTIQNYWRQ